MYAQATTTIDHIITDEPESPASSSKLDREGEKERERGQKLLVLNIREIFLIIYYDVLTVSIICETSSSCL